MAIKKSHETKIAVLSLDQVERRIYNIQGQKVMLDSDLAGLYDVETKLLTRAVRRNIERFPADFMFQVTPQELENLRRQIGTSSSNNYGGRRYMPYVFTEQGVAMLSSVLNSDRAVQVNIAIMRAFVNMRKLVATNADIEKKLTAIEKRIGRHDEDFQTVFAALRAMMSPENEPKQIGYIKNKRADKKA